MAGCHWNIFLNCYPFLHTYIFKLKIKNHSPNQNCMAITITPIASCLLWHTNKMCTTLVLVALQGRGHAHILQLFLQGVSWEGHLKFRVFFPFLLLSTLVERRCCKIQATLLQNKKRCQSQSCQELYFSSAWVRVGPVKQQFSLQWYSLVFSVVSWALVQA